MSSESYEFLFNQAPRYVGPLDHVADLPGRRALRSANSDRLLVSSVRLSSVKPFRSLHLVLGTICQLLLHLHRLMTYRYLFQRSQFRTSL